jgi:catalase
MTRLTLPLALRLLAIGVVLLVVGVAFAVAAGWLPPHRLGPGAIVDALEAHDGRHPGFRRAHAKGLCIEGSFHSNGKGALLSKAGLFARTDSPVIGRFSTGGGQPYAPDGRLAFRSLALSLTQANGEQWRMALDDTPIFPVATPQAFVDFQRATTPDPRTGKPDPGRVDAYMARHPETRAFLRWQQESPLSTSFANDTYYSINAFRFIDGTGKTWMVRWSFEPETPVEAIDKATLAAQPANFLFDDVIARLAGGPLRWHLVVTVAEPGDPTDDATKVWPADRHRVDIGTLEIGRALIEEDGGCRNITFDPLILPSGIAPSDDPLLPARSGVYASSLARRDGEHAQPSALANDPRAQGARP